MEVSGTMIDMDVMSTKVFIRRMERIASGLPPVMFGDGFQTMDFVHVADVARANIYAARAAVTDEVFNVASGHETTLKTVAETLLRAMGSPLRPEHAPERKVNLVPRRLADTRKAKAMLGFKTTTTLEEGMQSLVKWWKQERVSSAA